MSHPRYTAAQIVQRGQALYDSEIGPQVEAENFGKVLVIDIETGDYELDTDDVAASHRLHAKHPGGALYAMRVGSPTLRGGWERIKRGVGMIVGHVTARREAVIPLPLMTALSTTTFDVIVDTGFTEFLTLPPTLIASLTLPALNATAMTLADGSVIAVDVYEASVLWDGHTRTVKVHSADGDPLVGMALLYGYRLIIDAVDSGQVIIEPRTP